MEELFKNIAQRLYSENNLSDITWAFMMTCEQFKNDFIEFCFDEKIEGVCDLRREYQDEDSRPDLHFYDKDNQEYLIEVKIYDRNQHFDQYNNRFPNAKKAFISNYSLTEKEKQGSKNWAALKNWNRLYEEIEKNIDNYEMENVKKLIRSYLIFLKSVIGYREIEKMDFSELKSLMDFYKVIEEIASNNGFTAYDKYPSAINKNQYGRYFYKDNNDGLIAYFWFGLWLGKAEDISIWISFNNFKQASWLSPKYQENLNSVGNSGNFYSDKIIYGSGMWFKLDKEKFTETFCASTKNEKEQKELLSNFFNEVVLKVVKD